MQSVLKKRFLTLKNANLLVFSSLNRNFALSLQRNNRRLSDMADYKKFFKRENFIASMQAAKERKLKWEREVHAEGRLP